MTKVLLKTFEILETVAESAPRPVSLKELCEKLAMNKATCSRLALELVEMGYLEQPVARLGFVPGPMAAMLGLQARYEESLLLAAQDTIRQCAETLKATVMLRVLKQGRCYTFICHDFSPTRVVSLTPSVSADAFNTATGMVLLAHATEKDFDEAMTIRTPELSMRWHQYGGDKKKRTILDGIRQEGRLIHHETLPGYPSAVAYPVYKGQEVVAAIGCSIAPERLQDSEQHAFVAQHIATAAQTISARLTTTVAA